MPLFPPKYDICPNCGWVMQLDRVVVQKDLLNPGLALLGGIGFGITGALIGAVAGKTKKQTMYACSNINCNCIYDPYDFMEWKEEAIKRGEYHG